jgi:hypothetical protein
MITVISIVTACRTINWYQHLGRTCCLLLQGKNASHEARGMYIYWGMGTGNVGVTMVLEKTKNVSEKKRENFLRIKQK